KKHTMSIAHQLLTPTEPTSRNAILTQIWIAMISYLLLAYVQHCAREGWSVQRILRVLQMSLFEKKSISELLNPVPPDKQKSDPQMRIAL
ncbi:MAG: hypothetical protein V7731_24755, partial [Amphritea sp.]